MLYTPFGAHFGMERSVFLYQHQSTYRCCPVMAQIGLNIGDFWGDCRYDVPVLEDGLLELKFGMFIQVMHFKQVWYAFCAAWMLD